MGSSIVVAGNLQFKKVQREKKKRKLMKDRALWS